MGKGPNSMSSQDKFETTCAPGRECIAGAGPDRIVMELKLYVTLVTRANRARQLQILAVTPRTAR